MLIYKFLYWFIYLLFKPQISEISGLENLPKNEGFVLAANHQNSYDPLVLVAALKSFLWRNFIPQGKKLYFLGNVRLKVGVLKYSFISLAINLLGEKMGYLPAAREGLQKAIKRIKNGHVVTIFPEGHRNPQPTLLKGRRGVAVLALLSGAKIIPVGCLGPPTRGLRQHLAGFVRQKKVIFGPALSFPQTNQETIDQKPALLKIVTDCIMKEIGKTSQKQYPSNY
jgi:1-acyl-sn-glycerol-3-phosphate acyltransferase